MKPAEICMTRRLPILVDPSNPTFSLQVFFFWASQGTSIKRLVIKTHLQPSSKVCIKAWFWHKTLTLRQWSQSPFQRARQGGCRFPVVRRSISLFFSFERLTTEREREEQSWAQESVHLPPNASAEDVSRRWSRTRKPSSGFVGGCGLSKRGTLR